jgi:hypothetical protein
MLILLFVAEIPSLSLCIYREFDEFTIRPIHFPTILGFLFSYPTQER